MKKEKLVIVYWLDAHCEESWQDRKDILEFGKKAFNDTNRTFGEVVEETKDYILVATSFSPTRDLIADTMMIPRKMIRKIKIINLNQRKVK